MASAFLLVEAEEMTLKNYRLETGKSHASGGGIIGLRSRTGESGSASWQFSGISGLYDLELGYFDESDGVSQLEVRVDDITIATLTLDSQLGGDIDSAATAVKSKIASGIALKPGQTITILGTTNAGERARVDYLKFTPIDAETNNDGGDGGDVVIDDNQDLDEAIALDAVSYEEATGGIIAKVEENFIYTYTNATPLKIMPLGDSITHGVIGTRDRNSGGYRPFLERELTAERFALDFVGSKTSGPSHLSDRDYEGHPGKQISYISKNVEKWLSNSTPDVVLQTIGTNDIFRNNDSSETILEDLSELIDRITVHSPDTKLLVSSLPPIHPDEQSAEQVAKGEAISRGIPDLIDSKKSQQKNVGFVDFSSLTLDDLTSSINLDLDNGLHPNAGGYQKIASLWREAIYNQTGIKDSLLDVKNVRGSTFADSFFGDEFDNEFSGNAGNDYLVGNAGNDKLDGGSGNDTLIGGLGVDNLNGGSEADLFIFEKLQLESDFIEDFTVNSDKIAISAAGFGGGLTANTDLTEAQFTIGTTAIGTSDRLIYDNINGKLFFDPDGNGEETQVLFVNLASNLAISERDFTITA